MSWQLASLALLAIALAAGFAWYEREQPPARVLAVVASLAALAVVGRLAFAAIPNVKPTTDIVLFAGYALGAIPGFAVGRGHRDRVEHLPLAGALDRLADGRLGSGGRGRRTARPRAARARAEPLRPGRRLRPRGTPVRRLDGRVPVDLRGAPGPGQLHRRGRHLAALQRGARRGQRGLLPADRPGVPARARSLPAPARGALGALARADRGRRDGAGAPAGRARRGKRRHAGEPCRELPAAKRRTRTAASAARRGRARARSTPAGRAWRSAPPGATRAT